MSRAASLAASHPVWMGPNEFYTDSPGTSSLGSRGTSRDIFRSASESWESLSLRTATVNDVENMIKQHRTDHIVFKKCLTDTTFIRPHFALQDPMPGILRKRG